MRAKMLGIKSYVVEWMKIGMLPYRVTDLYGLINYSVNNINNPRTLVYTITIYL